MNRTSVLLRPHDLVRLVASVAAAGEGNPANLEDEQGMYHRTSVGEGNIMYRRADQIRPPFDQVTQVTASGQDSYPRIAKEPWGRLHIVFQRTVPGTPPTDNAWLTTSDDDGETWHTPTMAIPGGRKPIIRVRNDGTIIVAALAGGNILKATRQDPGALTPTAVFNVKDETGADLILEDDTFDIDWGRSGDAPCLLVCVPDGATSPVEFQSWDELQSVIQV